MKSFALQKKMDLFIECLMTFDASKISTLPEFNNANSIMIEWSLVGGRNERNSA